LNPQRHTDKIGRALYAETLANFVGSPPAPILVQLKAGLAQEGYLLRPGQVEAWNEEIAILQSALIGLEGSIYFEYTIPRMGRRADVLVLSRSTLFVIEFKAGAQDFSSAAISQVWDYGLDMAYFHKTSHTLTIVPILVASRGAIPVGSNQTGQRQDGVRNPLLVHPADLAKKVKEILALDSGRIVDRNWWESGSYSPTPTIIEAAISLYNRHSVSDISRSEAGATNLTRTSERLEGIISEAHNQRRKVLCLVTGVPGAGKTLVGLNIATSHLDPSGEEYAVYLSGNGPLVRVLTEALARDKRDRIHRQGGKPDIALCRTEAKSFIQNVHHFRDECLKDPSPPVEHVAVFDEAQRAWTKLRTSSFMQRRKNRPGFDQSEPEFLLSCMDRHADWAAVVCLVGEGQEINTGEAGVTEWLSAVSRSFPNWNVYVSDRLLPTAEAALSRPGLQWSPRLESSDELHLSVSMRSFRAEIISQLVEQILAPDPDGARNTLPGAEHYPIALTRSLVAGKKWVKEHARGSEKIGLLVSSSAERLKPQAVDVRVEIDPIHWFLAPPDDTRSSNFLEDAATEFQVQGLEIDWGCVAWDADLRFDGSQWDFWSFHGKRWKRVLNPDRRKYLRNAYRVLLTRARQGMVIVIPKGDTLDSTRSPDYYDRTFDYFEGLGLPVV
jgi:hypothetical protein